MLGSTRLLRGLSRRFWGLRRLRRIWEGNWAVRDARHVGDENIMRLGNPILPGLTARATPTCGAHCQDTEDNDNEQDEQQDCGSRG